MGPDPSYSEKRKELAIQLGLGTQGKGGPQPGRRPRK
jgi:predicted transcriptional regulator